MQEAQWSTAASLNGTEKLRHHFLAHMDHEAADTDHLV
jgi:hypothetical protein